MAGRGVVLSDLRATGPVLHRLSYPSVNWWRFLDRQFFGGVWWGWVRWGGVGWVTVTS